VDEFDDNHQFQLQSGGGEAGAFATLGNPDRIEELVKKHLGKIGEAETNGVRGFGDETAEDYDHTRR